MPDLSAKVKAINKAQAKTKKTSALADNPYVDGKKPTVKKTTARKTTTEKTTKPALPHIDPPKVKTTSITSNPDEFECMKLDIDTCYFGKTPWYKSWAFWDGAKIVVDVILIILLLIHLLIG